MINNSGEMTNLAMLRPGAQAWMRGRRAALTRSLGATAMTALLVSVVACGSDQPRTLSQDQVTELTTRFQTELDRLYEEAQATDEVFPGATAAFILPDGQVVGVATGYSDIEAKIPMTPDLRMPSGSIGKTYVAAVALSMALDGTLGLDDPIAEWLGDEPWFDRLPNGEDITLRMLLNHSGGLVDHAFDVPEFQEAAASLAADPDRYFEPAELVEFVLDREPLFVAGHGFNYTDTGYIIVGMVLERASGSTYYEELGRRITEPLGLLNTLPQDTRTIRDLAQGYAVASADLFGMPTKVIADGRMVFHPLTEWTGGGLYNNPQDLVRWAKQLYEGDAFDQPYLGDLLGSVADGAFENDSNQYALGVAINVGYLGTSYGHSGFFPGYNSRVGYFPAHGVAVAMQINADRTRVGPHVETLARLVIEALGAP